MASNKSKHDHPGWRLLIGGLLFLIMTSLLAAIADDVIQGEPLTFFDARLSAWLHANATPAATSFFVVVTLLGATVIGSAVSGVVAVQLARRKRFYWFTAFVISVYGGMILNVLLKRLFQRARPHFEDPTFSYTGYSFPSGHTVTATVVCGAIAIVVSAHVKSWRTRLLTAFAAGLVIAMVGFSRIYLGAHYLTDVVGAIAEGLAWLSLCFTAVYFFWRRRHLRFAADERK